MRPLAEEDPEKKTGKEVLDALIVPRQSEICQREKLFQCSNTDFALGE